MLAHPALTVAPPQEAHLLLCTPVLTHCCAPVAWVAHELSQVAPYEFQKLNEKKEKDEGKVVVREGGRWMGCAKSSPADAVVASAPPAHAATTFTDEQFAAALTLASDSSSKIIMLSHTLARARATQQSAPSS